MDGETARLALDKKLSVLPSLQQMQIPHKGWIKAIKQALGMSSKQLAMRLGVSAPRVTALEKSELEGTVTLATLKRAAEALDCALVYSFVPKHSLQDTVKNRARLVAVKLIDKVDHTMSLEAQSLNKNALDNEIERLATHILQDKQRILWDGKF